VSTGSNISGAIGGGIYASVEASVVLDIVFHPSTISNIPLELKNKEHTKRM
jgi:hypothetical protein